MTRLDAIVADLRHLLPRVADALREPVAQHKRGSAHGRPVQPPAPVERADVPLVDVLALERLRDALADVLGVALQAPVRSEAQEREHAERLAARQHSVRPPVEAIVGPGETGDAE